MLEIVPKAGDPAIISRIKKALMARFNPNSENDIEKAIELANYLVALDEYDQARDFLESFVYLDPGERRGELWVCNAQGIVLLAYIARVTGDDVSYRRVISVLERHDLWPADIGKVRWVRYHIKDHKKKVEYALTETQKYRCAILGQEVLSFLYFHELLFIASTPPFTARLIKGDVKSILAESQSLLVRALRE